MLDSAAQCNFVTSSLARKLNLPICKANIQLSGLGRTPVGTAKGTTKITFCSHLYPTRKYHLEALIIPKITHLQPNSSVSTKSWQPLKSLQLADPDFTTPSTVDILIGAELFYELVDGSKRIGSSAQAPVAINSSLGWLIGGGSKHNAVLPQANLLTAQNGPLTTQPTLEALLKSFWELESIPSASKWSKEEQICEQHFISTHTRTTDGRFVVRLPFKPAQPKLGESLHIAIRRFKQVERRVHQNPSNLTEYIKFMRDYESLGHMIEDPNPTAAKCYIPHHFVLKESSTTTKFRVVFDASAKTSTLVSLNDMLMIGPPTQDLLINIVMRFRKHKFVISADIEKMYRQVLVHPDDQLYQYIVWRESTDQPLKHYRLLTVTYGTAAAPYLATRTLKMLAESERQNFPMAARALIEDTYMDDLMTGAETEEECIELATQLRALLLKAGFILRKFTSNSEAVLESIDEDLRETKSLSLLDVDATLKLLGIYYNPVDDQFGFKTNFLSAEKNPQTKREFLSEVAKLYDPGGWVSPIIINPKIWMQSLWKEEIGWDQKIPKYIQERTDTSEQ